VKNTGSKNILLDSFNSEILAVVEASNMRGKFGYKRQLLYVESDFTRMASKTLMLLPDIQYPGEMIQNTKLVFISNRMRRCSYEHALHSAQKRLLSREKHLNHSVFGNFAIKTTRGIDKRWLSRSCIVHSTRGCLKIQYTVTV